MKVSTTGIVLACLLLIAGCSDSDPKPNPIIGTWLMFEIKPKVITTENDGDPVAYILSKTSGYKQEDAEALVRWFNNPMYYQPASYAVLVFNSDGTSTARSNAGETAGTWELSADDKALIFDKGKSNEQTATVTQLDENVLEIERSYPSEPTLPAIKFRVAVVFKKQKV